MKHGRPHVDTTSSGRMLKWQSRPKQVSDLICIALRPDPFTHSLKVDTLPEMKAEINDPPATVILLSLLAMHSQSDLGWLGKPPRYRFGRARFLPPSSPHTFWSSLFAVWRRLTSHKIDQLWLCKTSSEFLGLSTVKDGERESKARIRV